MFNLQTINLEEKDLRDRLETLEVIGIAALLNYLINL
jgi:hypothetical protein